MPHFAASSYQLEVSMVWLFSGQSVQGWSYDPGSSNLDSTSGLWLLLLRKRRLFFMEAAKLQRWRSITARNSPMPTRVEPVNKTNKAEDAADIQGQVHNNVYLWTFSYDKPINALFCVRQF